MSKYTDLSDDDLLDRYHKTGDNDWLGILLERYSLLLYGFCSRLLHDSTLARDAVQQVQLTVIQYLARNQVTPNELKVLSHITLLGSVFEPRDYLFILNSIRQAVKE